MRSSLLEIVCYKKQQQPQSPSTDKFKKSSNNDSFSTAQPRQRSTSTSTKGNVTMKIQQHGKPLISLQHPSVSDESESANIHDSGIFSGNNGGILRIVWEEVLYYNNADGNTSIPIMSKHRIAIYAYTASERNLGRIDEQPLLTLQLPRDAAIVPPCHDANVLCWTELNNNDDDSNVLNSKIKDKNTSMQTSRHPVLACLIHATAVIVWDVFPCKETSTLPSEGWTVPLPFECRAMFSAGSCNNRNYYNETHFSSGDFLLFQRIPSDTELVSHVNSSSMMLTNDEEEDRNTILSAPIPTLFTLHNILHDVLPVLELPSSSSSKNTKDTFCQQEHPTTSYPCSFNDVHEVVIWTNQSHMVTYKNKRHTIWKLTNAPPAPKQPKLHERIATKYTATATSGKRSNFLVDDEFNTSDLLVDFIDPAATGTNFDLDMGDPTLGGTISSSSNILLVATNSTAPPNLGAISTTMPARNRDDALASALGVRAPRDSPHPRRPRSSLLSTSNNGGPTTIAATPGVPNQTFHPQSNVTGTGFFNTTQQQHSSSFMATTTSTGASFLGAKLAVQSSFTIESEFSVQANCAFTICRGTVLCLQLVTALQLYHIDSTTNAISHLATIPSKSAQPLHDDIIVVVPCSDDNDETTINKSSSESNILQLWGVDISTTSVQQNGAFCITECCLDDDEFSSNILNGSIVRVEDAVNGHIHVRYSNNDTALVRFTHDVLHKGNAEKTAASSNYFKAAFLACLHHTDTMSQLFKKKLQLDLLRFDVPTVVLGILRCEINLPTSQSTPLQQKPKAQASPPSSSWDSLLLSDFDLRDNNLVQSFTNGIHDSGQERAEFDFDRLLTGQYLRKKKNQKPQSGSVNLIISESIFYALHFLYEDSKLSQYISGTPLLQTLVEILLILVHTDCNMDSTILQHFLQYYKQNITSDRFSAISCAVESEIIAANACTKSPACGFRFGGLTEPSSIFDWIERRMLSTRASFDQVNAVGLSFDGIPGTNTACRLLTLVVRIYTLLFDSNNSTTPAQDIAVVHCLVDEGFCNVSDVADEISAGVALPILTAIHRCRNHLYCADDILGLSERVCTLIGRDDLNRNYFPGKSGENNDLQQTPHALVNDDDMDGLTSLENSCASLFPDNRVHEGARLLRSSRPMFLRVARSVEVSDHDYEKLKQKRLLELARRALAIPIGRGMLTIGGMEPVPAEPLPVPELCLKGRVAPTNAALSPDLSDTRQDYEVWPHFHNGVAAGLRLPENRIRKQNSAITRAWIVYNRPPSISIPEGDEALSPEMKTLYAHGGLLFALGIRGYLSALDMTDIYDYLTQGTVTTTVGVLLGLAADKRGSCDTSVSKMIFLHLPSLIPQHFSAIDVASTVQTAAVIGAGLLYQGSSHRMMTEFLLNEIGKRPDSDCSIFEREAYTLACGLALASVNLRFGEKTEDVDRVAGLADLKVEERLIRYIIGGVDNDESRRTKETNDKFSIPAVSNEVGSDKSSIIYEGDMINTEVTAPGAILALGLMFMKTGNGAIAATLALPETHFLLEFVRPDFLGLRVIARSLVLWYSVQPTMDWVESQIPQGIRSAYESMRDAAQTTRFSAATEKSPGSDSNHFDRRSVRQVRAHVVAGACFSLGLRYAGSGNEKAKNVIIAVLQEFSTLRDVNNLQSIALRPEQPVLDECLGGVAFSLAMVLAGTGDLDALRILKILRWRCDERTHYGSHMMCGMAIGLLFLGGGTCTIGNEPEDIAALITAFFPRFPRHTRDNKFHLQALRHLYALAVKPRKLNAIDIDTGENVTASIVLRPANCHEPAKEMNVPCLLLNSDSAWKELEVNSSLYYPVKLDLAKITKERRSPSFFVKKRNAQVAGQWHRLELLPTRQVMQQNTAARIISTTDNSYLAAVARFFGDTEIEHILRQCQNEDSDEIIRIFLNLLHHDKGYTVSSDALAKMWSISLIQSYYRCKCNGGVAQHDGLIDEGVVLPYLMESAYNIQFKDFLADR